MIYLDDCSETNQIVQQAIEFSEVGVHMHWMLQQRAGASNWRRVGIADSDFAMQ